MMIKTKIVLLAVISLLALSGCVKDNGNYDYRNIPEFVADGYQVKVNDQSQTMLSGNKIVLNAQDLLNISVEGKFSENIEATYEWSVFLKEPPMNADNSFEPAKVIATGKDFNQPFTEAPGNYTLCFKALIPENGCAFYDRFEIEVEMIKGLFVLHADAENQGDYSAIRTAEMNLELPEEKLGQVDNIYSKNNDGAKVANPKAIWTRTEQEHKKIFLVSENSITTVNYGTHVKESDNYSSLFLFPPEKAPLPQGHINGANKKEYIIQNGDLCKIDYMSGNSTPLFSGHMGLRGKEYAPGMMSIPDIYLTVAFNKTDRKFEYEDWMGMVDFFSDGGPVDIANTGMELIYTTKGNGSFIDAVMKDDQDKFHYVRFSIVDQYQGVSCTCDMDIPAQTGVSDQSLWAVGARGVVAFFSCGNELYVLNYQNQQITPAGLELPTGAEISVVEVLNDPENQVYDNALIFIGYNLNGEGHILQYRFNSLDGRINKDSRKAFSGFGQIVDVVLKK